MTIGPFVPTQLNQRRPEASHAKEMRFMSAFWMPRAGRRWTSRLTVLTWNDAKKRELSQA
jgi:hypothetical protein